MRTNSGLLAGKFQSDTQMRKLRPRVGRIFCVIVPSECGLSRAGHAERSWAS